ncbi:signal recognition particle-docking protein FtsY [Pediococcus siamensis]|uniref:signal recognition particle-docking protein FtsY n=1 Tax=Pediococcus siamensis TaxID=381829 RepID=UPI00399EF2D1
MSLFGRRKKKKLAEQQALEQAETQKQAQVEEQTAAKSTVSESEPKVGPETLTSQPEEEVDRYNRGLEKSRRTFGQKLTALFTNFNGVDDDFYDDLEETLIGADVGFDTAVQISDEVREEIETNHVSGQKEISNLIVAKLVSLYTRNGTKEDNHLVFATEGPSVFLFVGVNGVGKTTSIGKLAARFKKRGKKVLLAACDTFRAGAIEQLQEWGKRDGVPVVAGPEKSDPAAIVFDAVQKAKKEDYDLVLVDTAGRLQNKVNLMKELDKMRRVITREIPHAPQEILLVLDATTGQNAMNQAKVFQETTDVTGIILTKLDGTAKGGIVLAIRNQLHLSVKYVGLGEQVDDLSPFSPQEFVDGLFSDFLEPTK